MDLTVPTEVMEFEGRTITCGILEMGNAILAFFWDAEEPTLGSMTLTTPGRTSTQLLGDRDQLISMVLGNYLATKYNKLSIVSTNLRKGYPESIGREMIEMVKRIMEKD